MTAVLIAESGDMDKVPEIIRECERMGVKVKPPDVNESLKTFAMIGWENGGEAHIRFGLSGVKNLGEHIAEAIYLERKSGGPYKDLTDFLQRVQHKDLNKKSLDSLIKCGALDCFGYDRGVLLVYYISPRISVNKKELRKILFLPAPELISLPSSI